VVWCRWGSGDFLLEIERRFRDERERAHCPANQRGRKSRVSVGQLPIPSDFVPAHFACLHSAFDVLRLTFTVSLFLVSFCDTIHPPTMSDKLTRYVFAPAAADGENFLDFLFLTTCLQYCHCQQRQGEFAAFSALKSAY
jgi:hypothetical protein